MIVIGPQNAVSFDSNSIDWTIRSSRTSATNRARNVSVCSLVLPGNA